MLQKNLSRVYSIQFAFKVIKNQTIVTNYKNMNKIFLGKYEHYKGGQYEVIDIAKHSETLEELVIYRALYGEHGLWARPLKMFLETVEIEGKEIPRFKFMNSK